MATVQASGTDARASILAALSVNRDQAAEEKGGRETRFLTLLVTQVRNHPALPLQLEILRDGKILWLQVTPQAVAVDELPKVLRGNTGTVYRVAEQVISPASLIALLAERNRAAIVQIDASRGVEFARSTEHSSHSIQLRSPSGARRITVTADWIILAAGRANAELREQLRLAPQAMQTRPLHMLLVRGDLDRHGEQDFTHLRQDDRTPD